MGHTLHTYTHTRHAWTHYGGLLTQFLPPLLQYHLLSKPQPAALQSRTTACGIQAAWPREGCEGSLLSPNNRVSLTFLSFPFINRESAQSFLPLFSSPDTSYTVLLPPPSADDDDDDDCFASVSRRGDAAAFSTVTSIPQSNFESVHLRSVPWEQRDVDHMQP